MTINNGPYFEQTETVIETPVAQTVVQQGGVVAAPVVAAPAVAAPVVAAPVAAPVVAAPVVAAPIAGTRVRRAYSSHFEPDAVIAALVGLALLLIGLIAVTRGGFDGEMSDPVVEVLGFTHTTSLGLIEIALGVFLLIAGAARSRSGAMFFGAVLGVAGFVGAVQSESFATSLALESSMAWLAVVAGAIVVLSALMLPRFAKHSTVIENA